MKHYELLKLVPGTDPVEVQEKLRKYLRELDSTKDWLNHPVVHCGCRQEDDYDLMIVVEIDAEERMGELVDDPLALEYQGKIAQYLKKRKSFDHY